MGRTWERISRFHGHTLAALSATGQTTYRKRFNVLVQHYTFVPFNDVGAIERAMDDDTAAVLIEPIQGEGGIIVPDKDYWPLNYSIPKRPPFFMIRVLKKALS